MKKTNLTQTINNADSVRLVNKADPFLGKVEIKGPENEIFIKPGATAIRLKSGKVLFYSVNPNISNGYIVIPHGSKIVQFSHYEPHKYNINYGEPKFY